MGNLIETYSEFVEALNPYLKWRPPFFRISL